MQNFLGIYVGENSTGSKLKTSSRISTKESDIYLVEKAVPVISDIAGPSMNPLLTCAESTS
jgi:hypothetical protein